jgi:PAS domain S-box-containing protein
MTMKDEDYTLLRSAALQNAATIRIARERAEQRQETYLAEAQRLSRTGSFGWNVATGEIIWSDEIYRIFQYDRTTEPTMERALQRAHPEDAARVRQVFDGARHEKKDFELEHRLLMPDGSVMHLRVVARAMEDESGNVEFVGAVMDITERKRGEMLLAGEKRLLEMIARGKAPASILDALCRLVEGLASGSLSSILLLDANAGRLRHGAAPSLPIAYTEAIDGVGIGPSVGSCGTAAYRGEPVMVCDIATDPLWADFRALALAHGLLACWSAPILSSDGKVLGTFATYYREPRSPTAQELGLIEQVTHLASIAIEREQAEEALRERASLLDLTRDTVFVRDMNDTVTYWNRGAEELYGWSREQAVGKTTHGLLQTSFQVPLAESNAELLRTGQWEGELTHTKRDGTQVVVASRWALQRDGCGSAVAILETNNDITERKRKEAELLHKTALLDELFEGSPDAMVLMNLEARVLRISREFAALFGYAAEEAAGRRIVDLIVPQDELEDSRGGFARVRSGERFVVERERRRKDGTRIHVSIKRAPIVLGGKQIGYYGIYRDITERRRAEEALRLSEERYALAMLAAEDAHWDWIVGTDRYYLSPRSLDLFGLPPDTVFTSREDYLARTPLVLEDLEKWQRAMAELFAGTGSRLSMELRAIVRGEIRWLQHIGVCVRDASGKPVRWCGTARDITERRHTEEALRQSETRYRNIFQTVGVSIWEEDFSQVKAAIDALKDSGVHDFRRYLAAHPQFAQQAISMVRVVDVNDVTLKLFAAESKDELLASLHRIFLPETREVFVEELVTIAEGRTSFEAETVLQSLKGARLTVLFTIAFPARDARFDRVLVTITDVTEQRAREREREEMARRLQQAARMEAIGRLAGGIAHDFNNILGAILGYGELAQKNLEGRAVRRHVDQVMQAGARGKGLVERILAFSRSGLGERAPLHVQAVVEEALDLLAASLPSNVHLRKQLDAGDAAVVGDATQLHQVAMNLCTNALQAMDQGGVLTVLLDRAAVPERRLLSHGTLASGTYVRLRVSDTGRGIPPAVLERMFDPFFTTKRVGDGTGLGLSLVHAIVADFGGAIDVATQSGAGSTFTVWLPAAGETPRPVAEPAGELPHGNGETVMIVDDERALVALAEETLAALGYEPAGFDSSVAALEAFRAEPRRFDLVLTDETMPDLSGVELANEMRRVRPELPIVLMSGYSGAQLTERAQASGVAQVLRKPLVRRDIAEALGRALRPANDLELQ